MIWSLDTDDFADTCLLDVYPMLKTVVNDLNDPLLAKRNASDKTLASNTDTNVKADSKVKSTTTNIVTVSSSGTKSKVSTGRIVTLAKPVTKPNIIAPQPTTVTSPSRVQPDSKVTPATKVLKSDKEQINQQKQHTKKQLKIHKEQQDHSQKNKQPIMSTGKQIKSNIPRVNTIRRRNKKRRLSPAQRRILLLRRNKAGNSRRGGRRNNRRVIRNKINNIDKIEPVTKGTTGNNRNITIASTLRRDEVNTVDNSLQRIMNTPGKNMNRNKVKSKLTLLNNNNKTSTGTINDNIFDKRNIHDTTGTSVKEIKHKQNNGETNVKNMSQVSTIKKKKNTAIVNEPDNNETNMLRKDSTQAKHTGKIQHKTTNDTSVNNPTVVTFGTNLRIARRKPAPSRKVDERKQITVTNMKVKRKSKNNRKSKINRKSIDTNQSSKTLTTISPTMLTNKDTSTNTIVSDNSKKMGSKIVKTASLAHISSKLHKIKAKTNIRRPTKIKMKSQRRRVLRKGKHLKRRRRRKMKSHKIDQQTTR